MCSAMIAIGSVAAPDANARSANSAAGPGLPANISLLRHPRVDEGKLHRRLGLVGEQLGARS